MRYLLEQEVADRAAIAAQEAVEYATAVRRFKAFALHQPIVVPAKRKQMAKQPQYEKVIRKLGCKKKCERLPLKLSHVGTTTSNDGAPKPIGEATEAETMSIPDLASSDASFELQCASSVASVDSKYSDEDRDWQSKELQEAIRARRENIAMITSEHNEASEDDSDDFHFTDPEPPSVTILTLATSFPKTPKRSPRQRSPRQQEIRMCIPHPPKVATRERRVAVASRNLARDFLNELEHEMFPVPYEDHSQSSVVDQLPPVRHRTLKPNEVCRKHIPEAPPWKIVKALPPNLLLKSSTRDVMWKLRHEV